MAAKRFLIFLFILCLFLPNASSHAQTDPPFKYRSYYPAPYGEFTKLRLFPQTETACGGTTGVTCPQIYGALGDPCEHLGKIYFNQGDNRLYSCNRDVTLPVNALGTNLNWGFLVGPWKQEGSYLFLTDPSSLTYEDPVFVGIGTDPTNTPFKLTIANGGGIIAAGALDQGTQFLNPGEATIFLWYPRKSALRIGAVDDYIPLRVIEDLTAATWQDDRIAKHSIVFGRGNEVAAEHSAALGGESVTIGFNSPAAVPGALTPCAAGDDPHHSVVLMGQNLNDTGETSTNIYCWAPHSIVITEGNIRSATAATPSNHSTLFSGNIANSHHATVFGGTAQNAPFAFIGREITDNDPVNPVLQTNIINDLDVPLQNTHQTILASHGSITNSNHAFLGSGSNNNINDSHFSAILGGTGHTIYKNNYSIILGGSSNTASGIDAPSTTIEHAFIGGGQNNKVLSDYSIVVGGENNEAGSLKNLSNPSITGHATHAAVVGGKNNKAWGHFSFIGGGLDNKIGKNTLEESLGQYSVIIGGEKNTILSNYAFIGGGKNNTINDGADYSVIEGGENITVNGDHSWAFGRNVTVNGDNSWAFGYTNGSPITVNDNNVFIMMNVPDAVAGINPITVGFNINPPATPPAVATLDVNLNVTATSLIVRNAAGPGGDQLYLQHQTTWPQEFFPIGKDLAEIFPASEKVSPGDVLIIDDTDELALKKSRSSYNPKVVGVVSTAPALILEGERIVADFAFTDNETLSPPVALAGQVPCKVSLENGPIAYGDLLTTSSTPGHAMKATDQSLFFGTILGKALEPFNDEISSGNQTGLIKILVTLQ